MDKFTELEKQIGIQFKDRKLLKNVFIHRSYLNENFDPNLSSNEKLEFLGDSVLSLTTSIYLYKSYSDLKEGDYTDIKASIVRTESLAEVARKLNLGSYLYLSHGEEKGKGKDKTNILADLFEALIAAIFIEKGFETAYNFILNNLFKNKLDNIISQKLYLSPKSRLQELTQGTYKELPEYILVESTGPDHKKVFTVSVKVHGVEKGRGVGKSKKQAEEAAAQNAVDSLK
jgi:ribonuclease-3